MPREFTVCYFGAYRPSYPRNLTIRRTLAATGVSVVECCVPPKYPNYIKWPTLTARFLRSQAARTASVIIVAEFCHTLVTLAWILSRLNGAALIFDPGISYYDEMILSQQTAPFLSLRALYLRVVDTVAFALSDLVVWFTPVDEEHFGKIYRIPPDRSDWLPPGVDEDLFAFSPPPDTNSPFIVHWDGSFIPSHGVEVILEAANLLRHDHNIRFELVGDGPMARAMRERAQEMGLPNVTFFGSVDMQALVDAVRRSHVCLGAFRADDKQRRSLYTKELQAMLTGRAVITAAGEAKRRLFHAGDELLLVPPGDAGALAEAIAQLRADPERRRMIGKRGHEAVAALCGKDSIQSRLLAILGRALDNRRGSSVGHKQ